MTALMGLPTNQHRMKPSYPVLLSVASFFSLPSAAQQLPTMYAQDTVSMPCPWDTAQTIHTYQGWEAYQTVNNEWDGPRDSTVCIDLFEMVGNFPYPRLRFDQCDISRAVFVRALLDSASAIPLTSNNIYGLYTTPYPSDWSAIDTTANCPNGLCTGVQVAVRVPDSLGTSQLLRWHQGGYTGSLFSGPAIDLCIPTERMVGNALREVIYRYTPTAGASAEHVDLYTPEIIDQMMNWGVQQITEATMPQFSQGQFDYAFWGGGQYNLVMYEDSTYPSADHMSYLDVLPIPNVPAPSTITVTLDQFANIAFQPYTQLRAGYVLNNDSVFHNLVFVNQGELCMSYNFVEVFWENGSRYVHAGGEVHLDGAMSCFLFKPGSTLEVAAGERFDYGFGGRGMIGLREGCNIDIKPGAELVFHNMVDMKEGPGATTSGKLETMLGIGSRLSFGPGARLHNANSIGSALKWYVYLDGGTCDISNLSVEDQQKIVLVQLPARAAGDIELQASAVNDELVFDLPVRENVEAEVRVLDAAGRDVLFTVRALLPGGNNVRVAIPGLRAGSYVLDVRVADERRTARFIKA